MCQPNLTRRMATSERPQIAGGAPPGWWLAPDWAGWAAWSSPARRPRPRAWRSPKGADGCDRCCNGVLTPRRPRWRGDNASPTAPPPGGRRWAVVRSPRASTRHQEQDHRPQPRVPARRGRHQDDGEARLRLGGVEPSTRSGATGLSTPSTSRVSRSTSPRRRGPSGALAPGPTSSSRQPARPTDGEHSDGRRLRDPESLQRLHSGDAPWGSGHDAR